MSSRMVGMTVDSLLAQLREAIKAEVRDEVRAELIAELGGGGPKKIARKGPVVLATGRRSPEAVEQTGRLVLAWVRKNPMSRVEQIAEGLGVSTKTLTLPIMKLLEERKLAKKGVKRGTTYQVRP